MTLPACHIRVVRKRYSETKANLVTAMIPTFPEALPARPLVNFSSSQWTSACPCQSKLLQTPAGKDYMSIRRIYL